MLKQKFSKYLVFISIFTFLSIFGLIVQVSYTKLVGPIKKVQSSELIKPIDPKFDFETLDQIEKREKLVSTSSSEILVP